MSAPNVSLKCRMLNNRVAKVHNVKIAMKPC